MNNNKSLFILFLASFNCLFNISAVHAQKTEDQTSEQAFDAVYSQCQTLVQTNDPSWEEFNVVGPSSAGFDFFMTKHNVYDTNQLQKMYKSWNSTLVQEPIHGELKQLEDDAVDFLYVPETNYYGPDQMTYVLEAEGIKLKITESIYVSKGIPERGHPGCENSFGLEEIKVTN